MATALVIVVETKPEGVDAFLKIIESTAANSRKEPGCLQFDVFRTQDDSNKFILYEVYKSAADVEFHREQPYYKEVLAFKEAGGFDILDFKAADGVFLTDK